MKQQAAAITDPKTRTKRSRRASASVTAAKSGRVDDEGVSASLLEAYAKWPPGHPERLRAAVAEFRGEFEPEFWDAVLAARRMGRYGSVPGK